MPAASPLPPRFAAAPFSTGTAIAAGIPRKRLRARDLSAPFHGVRSADAPVDVRSWCRSFATRMSPTMAFSHQTAALLWGLPLPPTAPLPLQVTAFSGREPRGRGIRGHRIGADRLAIEHLEGLPVVSPCDAWCLLASSLAHDDLVAAGDRLVGWPRPLASLEEVDAAIARHAGGRGVAALRRARRDIRTRSASRRETFLRLAVIRAGLPEPECNGPIRLSSGALLYGDLVLRRERVILEYDGDQHRTDDRQFARDVERLNELAADGWLVIRLRKGMRRGDVLPQLAAALAARRPR